MAKFWFLLYFVFLLGIGYGRESHPPSSYRADGNTEKRQDTKIQGDFYFGIQTIKYMFFLWVPIRSNPPLSCLEFTLTLYHNLSL